MKRACVIRQSGILFFRAEFLLLTPDSRSVHETSLKRQDFIGPRLHDGTT